MRKYILFSNMKALLAEKLRECRLLFRKRHNRALRPQLPAHLHVITKLSAPDAKSLHSCRRITSNSSIY